MLWAATREGTAISTPAQAPDGEPFPAAVTQADPTGGADLRAILRIRPFRRLWLVLSVASLGDWLGLLATATFASAQVSGDAAKGFAFGGVIAIRLLPALVLGPLAGVMADRFDRRYTMVICDLLRFVLFATIPTVALYSTDAKITVGWAAVATFIIEAITLIWIPAKEAAVPNLIPRARLEAANQLTLISTYGITPVLAAAVLAVLNQFYAWLEKSGTHVAAWADPSSLALYFNSLSRLATALVVFFGIREISGHNGKQQRSESMLRQFVDGWRFIGKTPMVRGLVFGILGAFAAGGVVIGTAQFFAKSLGGGDSTFAILFAVIFIGLGFGIALGPRLIGALSRKRWFCLSIMLAGASVALLSLAPHLSLAVVGALLVGSGAGMAFLSGTTLLGGEVGDEVRGRVFATVQIGTRVVLMLAISLSGVLVGVGGSHDVGGTGVPISSTRVLLGVAGVLGVLAGFWALRQMDDKPGVPLFADLIGSVRGRPLTAAEHSVRQGVFVVFEGGEGAGKSTQIALLAQRLRAEDRDVVVTREPGATEIGARIRKMVLETSAAPAEAGAPLAPRAEALLYAADRAHHVTTVVRPALARGAVVISDRYVDSSLAYQGAGRTLPVDEISWLSTWATGGLRPELVVLLDVDPKVGLARVDRRGSADRLESESLAFHERVRYGFLDLAAKDPDRYLVLDATRAEDDLAAAVAARVSALLPAAPRDTDPAAPDEQPRPHGVAEPRTPGESSAELRTSRA
ncbi:dTMP kinase [Catellatospora sp. KI3]|uniref:dTMP kinase n=1 Tax=Catellatospora sp. KI3 TaxID=3041620 RepID=UPI002482C8AB|nr:dTMP kinase [Catellatospora sp. KI3]MDI1461942.1 dTMP kinase [Catellatospora sp. KI3]